MNTPDLSGTVTFLFTDIEGSTRLWEQYPDTMKGVLARHDALLRQAVETNQGRIVKTTGDGCHAVFGTAISALAAALTAQRALVMEGWAGLPHGLRVRMGVHTGEAEARGGDYYGSAVNRAARLMSVGHGGQVLVSASTAELARDALPSDTHLLDLGEHRLKDLVRPEHIFQLAQAGLPAEFPPLKSLDAFPNNLPIQVSSFVGREREITETRDLLDGARLLTLTGSGGTGKTRLSLQLAAELLPAFPDGVWLVELAPINNPDLVVQTIAAALELKSVPGIPLQALVIDYLRGKHLLLLLDNCEHLIEASAQLAETILRACPGVKIIASSREALGIAGEVAYSVPSLSQPDLSLSDPSQLSVAALASCESVQLFLERAQAANPHFRLTEANAAAVAQICLRLDGIPLALELAAARTRFFSAEQIADRLDDRFRLLTGGSRTALPRQQTLRALIDWSYDLLAPPERALLLRLSVFVNGWTLEAAEAIYPDGNVLELLPQLVNKSLVIANERQGQARGGGSNHSNVENRYRLLETIRQYARDRLFESGEMTAVRDQHFAYFLRLSDEAEPQLRTAAALDWIERLDPDFDNIRTAMEWGQEQRPEEALRLADNLRFIWPFRINGLGGLQLMQGLMSRVEALPPADGAAMVKRAQLRAIGKGVIGLLNWGLGDNRTAAKWVKEGADLARVTGDQFTLAFDLAMLGQLQIFLGDYPLMRACLEESYAIFNQLGNRLWLLIALPQMSLLERQAGNLEASMRFLYDSRQITAQFTHPVLLPLLLGAGIEARNAGHYDLAQEFYEKALVLAQRMKSPHFQAALSSELLHLTRLEGKFEAAEQGYRQIIGRWVALGHRGAVINTLECLAYLARARDHCERAARLLGASEALRESTGLVMANYEGPMYEQEVAALRDQMDGQALAAEWAAGRRMDMDQAVAYATRY